jgi:hypothetical protein
MSNNDSMMTYLILGALVGYLIASRTQKANLVSAELGSEDDVVSPTFFGAASGFASAGPVTRGRRGAPKGTPIFKPAPAPKTAPAPTPTPAPAPAPAPVVVQPQPKAVPKAVPKALKSNWFGSNDITMPEIMVNDGVPKPLQPGLR